jgi:PHP family Zn ribbon phosphoesterase
LQPRQNNHPNKIAREVVFVDIDRSGYEEAKSGIKTKGGKK